MSNISISCPNCAQSFFISDEYFGKRVECGACKHRFRVTEEAALSTRKSQKKSYPGEKASNNKETFSKRAGSAPLADKQSVAFEPASYNHPLMHGKMGPKHWLMVLAGLAIMGITIYLFATQTREGGMIEHLDLNKRLAVAIFATIFGCILLMVGMTKKLVGLVLSLIIGGIIIAMPYLAPAYSPSEPSPQNEAPLKPSDSSSKVLGRKAHSLDQLKDEIGYQKVLDAKAESKHPEDIKALVIGKSKEEYMFLVINYLEESLDLPQAPASYSQRRHFLETKATLIVLDTKKSYQEIYDAVSSIGPVTEIKSEEGEVLFVATMLNEEVFRVKDTKRLSDPEDAAYFDLNLKELSSLDYDRRLSALRRLNAYNGDTIGMRSDLCRKAQSFIKASNKEISNEAITFLTRWTRPDYGSTKVILDYAIEINDAGGRLDASVSAYLNKFNPSEAAPLYTKLWLSPRGRFLYDQLLINADRVGESVIIRALPNAPQSHMKSAASILSHVGTARAIPALRAAAARTSGENRKYLQAAIDEINSRR